MSNDVIKTNHYEVYLSDEHMLYDLLRLAAHSIKCNSISGKIEFSVFAIDDVVKCIKENFYDNKRLHIKYVLYSDDGSASYVVYENNVYLKDVVYESHDECQSMLIKLLLSDSYEKHLIKD
jgi:hypothetical protein